MIEIIEEPTEKFRPFKIKVNLELDIRTPEDALALYGLFNYAPLSNDKDWESYGEHLRNMGLKPRGTLGGYWASYCNENSLDWTSGR